MYPKNKSIPFRRSLLAIVALGLGAVPGLRAETPAQAALRSQISRFWQVAEERVTLDAAPVADPPAAVEAPVRPLPPLRSAVRPVPRIPSSTVEIRQSADHRDTRGHFGFSLFGGVRLFEFDWGEVRNDERDALQGRL